MVSSSHGKQIRRTNAAGAALSPAIANMVTFALCIQHMQSVCHFYGTKSNTETTHEKQQLPVCFCFPQIQRRNHT